jgi:hypothetical protein
MKFLNLRILTHGMKVFMVFLFIAGAGLSCSQKEKIKVVLPVSNQKVPIILGIGPMDTTHLIFKDNSIDPDFAGKFRLFLQDTLVRTGKFKQVVLVPDGEHELQGLEFSSIRSNAQQLQADLFLIAEVVAFHADPPSMIGKFQYAMTTDIRVQLFETYSGKQVWEKTDTVRAIRASFYETPWGSRDTLRILLEETVIPSATAGLLQPMVKHVQSEYKNFATARPATSDSTNLFNTAQFAKIDAELAPPSTSVSEKHHAYALVMGLEHYQRFPQVDFALRDSAMIYRYLHEAMGFPAKNIAFLQDTDVTLSQMRARIETWLPSLVGDNPEAEVFVYYGGHGTTDVKSNKAFLVPYDADLSFLAETAYPVEQLYDRLGKLKAKQVTVVLDSCFSGAGGRSVMQKGARPMVMTTDIPPVPSSNLVVFTASGAKEISSAFQTKSHGLFTYFFLKGMKGDADTNQDGRVSIQEQFDFVSHQVQTTARAMNRDQQPQLFPTLEELKNRSHQTLIHLQ